MNDMRRDELNDCGLIACGRFAVLENARQHILYIIYGSY